MSEFGDCRSCGATVRWCVTKRSRAIPLDPAPVPDGNVCIEGTLGGKDLAKTLAGRDLELARRSACRLFKSHFATCPQAEEWRRGH